MESENLKKGWDGMVWDGVEWVGTDGIEGPVEDNGRRGYSIRFAVFVIFYVWRADGVGDFRCPTLIRLST
jgi:hypothetical protein